MFKTAEEAFQKVQDHIAQTIKELPPIIGEEAVNFFIDNFDQQGWQGDSFEPWQKRLNPNPPLPHESFRVAFYKKSNILNTTISSKSPFSSA